MYFIILTKFKFIKHPVPKHQFLVYYIIILGVKYSIEY